MSSDKGNPQRATVDARGLVSKLSLHIKLLCATCFVCVASKPASVGSDVLPGTLKICTSVIENYIPVEPDFPRVECVGM